MSAEKYLQILQKDIQSVIFATTDEKNFPVTCVIDVMLADSYGLYFLTAKGKAFYDRLKRQPVISLTGLKGNDTMHSQSITLRGEVREIGQERLNEIFVKNPYMEKIYPNRESRSALTVFQIYKGNGEFFDLSSKPISRKKFSFGGMENHTTLFYITEKCSGCKSCFRICPQQCIDISKRPFQIQQEHCLHCGKCKEICPEQAVERRTI
ncbi:MAG: 4Fe-4S binding protein [Coriobacteriia bacterium]|nr:4Fe-4S binding protein [Coriobacteriia bacterium]